MSTELAFAVQCSPTFAGHLRVLASSLQRFHPRSPVVVYGYDGYSCKYAETVATGKDWRQLSADRPRIVKEMLGRYDRVCFLGADTELFGPLTDAERRLDSCDMLVCPHWFGCEVEVNADFQMWKNGEHVDWYVKYCREFPNEQRCLSYMPYKFRTCRVWHQKTVNVMPHNAEAYHFAECPVPAGHRSNWIRWSTDGGPLALFHYAAYDRHNPDFYDWVFRGEGLCRRSLRKLYREYASKVAEVSS